MSWADRQSVPVIAFGTIIGHGICTLGAVMGGRLLSTKISVKHSASAAPSWLAQLTSSHSDRCSRICHFCIALCARGVVHP